METNKIEKTVDNIGLGVVILMAFGWLFAFAVWPFGLKSVAVISFSIGLSSLLAAVSFTMNSEKIKKLLCNKNWKKQPKTLLFHIIMLCLSILVGVLFYISI